MADQVREFERMLTELRASLGKVATVTAVNTGAREATVDVGDGNTMTLKYTLNYTPATGHVVAIWRLLPDSWLILARLA